MNRIDTSITITKTSFPTSAFIGAFFINMVWVNISEVFRYFVFIMPMMREAFPQIESVAPMDFGVFAIWGLWDTIIIFSITGFTWLFLDRFGSGLRNAIIAGTLLWLSVFVVLWLGLWNMNLTTWKIVSVAIHFD